MAFWSWSRTSASNGTADSTIYMAEGMAPSGVNDGIRSLMAALRMYGDDISGAIVTGGTSTAYTVASYSGFDTLAHLDKQIIAFSPHATNGAGPVTLNIDSQGAKPLRAAPNTELLAGVLIAGTPYVALYSNTDGAFYLHGYYGQPLNVPLFAGMDYWDTVTPNSSFIFPAGQAISRTTYATAFARWGTKFGSGDGSTTFNVPDKTERVSVMMASVASRLTSTYFGGNSTVLGAVGGGESQTLTLAQLPTGITSGNAAQAISVISTVGGIPSAMDNGGFLAYNGASSGYYSPGKNGAGGTVPLGQISSTGNNSIGVTSNNTGGNAHPNVQPTIVCNYIMRII